MFPGKVCKPRAKEGLQQNDSNNQCCWIPGTPVKKHNVLVDLNKNIDEWQDIVEAEATPASQESDKLSLVLVSGKEPEPERKNFLFASSPESCVSQRNLCPDSKIDGNIEEPDSGNFLPANSDLLPNWDDANNVKNLQNGKYSPESCVWQQNLKEGLKRGPKQKPKRKKIRPRVIVDGKPKKTPQPKTPKPKKTLQPKTPKPETLKPANEATRKRKYVRKHAKESFVSGDVVDELVSEKRKCARGNSKNNSDAIIELPLPFPAKSCRQALNFGLESRDDKDIIAITELCGVREDECAILECRVQVDECTIPECEVQVDEYGDTWKPWGKYKTSTRSRRRRRLNILFMRNLPVLQVQYPRGRRRSRRVTRRCNIALMTAIPVCSQLPKLPSKQEARSEKEEAEIIYEPEASKDMLLLTNNIEINVAGTTEIETCVLDDKKNEGSPLKYEDFPLTSYLTDIDSQDSIIKKHPLELENFELVDQTIGTQKVMQEPGVSFLFSQDALPLFPEQRIDSPAAFPGQSSVLAPSPGQNIGALELLLQQHIGVLEVFPEGNTMEPDQSNGALELFPIQAINSQEMHSTESLREQIMYRLEQLQEQIIGPSSQQVLQDKNPVIQRKSLNPEDLFLNAKSRDVDSEGIIQVERNHLPTQKRSPHHSSGLQVGMDQQLMQLTTADITRKSEALASGDTKAYGPSCGHGAVVPYQVGPSGVHGALVPYKVKEKRKKLRPEVDLDPGTLRMWNLIMNIDDGTSKDQKIRDEKWWEKERQVFGGRILSFTARMHLILGDRRFKQWKGSVVDSVVGVYLTQNVSDNLSSSAYMSLAARFPLKSTSNHTESDKNLAIAASQQSIGRENMYFVTEPGPDRCCELKDGVDPIDSRIQGNSLLEIEHTRVMKDAAASKTFDTSSVKSLDRIQLSPSPSKTCSTESYITASTEILLPGNTTSLQVLHDKVDDMLFCDECLDGYITPTRMDNGSQASNSRRNNLKSDSGSISFNDPFEISVSPLNQESSRTDMPQAQDTTTTSKKSPSGKRPRLMESKSDMINDGTKETTPKKKDGNQEQQDWDLLRRIYSNGAERSCDQMDSVDWEAVRCADVSEIADAIKERGQQNRIAGRIKDFLNRLVELHSCIDLEWLRNVPPDKVKDYLLDIQGLGLKSVECVRLLSLQHIAFPVDVNVGRIAVRLGWVPLQPLPGGLHIHLLEEYPVMDTIQKYLWPRLCCLDQKTLYELHYQMITFGKVFCKKRNPNCGACPLKGECKHFASAFASARLALPGPSEKGIVKSDYGNGIGGNPPLVVNPIPMVPIEAEWNSEFGCQINNCEPIIEEPESPGPDQCSESPESDIDDDFSVGDIEDIPMIRLQEREFQENVQNFMEMNNTTLPDSRALVLLTAEAASMPARKLKEYSHLRTRHMVYVLPDNHELLQGFERRDPYDPSPYLLAIWYPGETPNSVVPLQYRCHSKESELCNSKICYSCNCTREKNAGIVRGTILIPCRTANRGRFPLNGTYFQVNEVFADHETSYSPINVPTHMIADLPVQTACFGTSATSIFNALHLRGIQECFWRGFVCVRGFDRRYRCPRPLTKRFHCPPSKKEAAIKRSRDET